MGTNYQRNTSQNDQQMPGIPLSSAPQCSSKPLTSGWRGSWCKVCSPVHSSHSWQMSVKTSILRKNYPSAVGGLPMAYQKSIFSQFCMSQPQMLKQSLVPFLLYKSEEPWLQGTSGTRESEHMQHMQFTFIAHATDCSLLPFKQLSLLQWLRKSLAQWLTCGRCSTTHQRKWKLSRVCNQSYAYQSWRW